MHRHLARDHHPDLDQLVSRALQRGAVDMEVIKRWWLPIVLGVAAGSVTARFAPERLFKIVFVMVAWSAAARLLLARDAWKFGDEMPKGFLMRLYGFFVGLLSTLMGIGGGLFANLLMTFYGRPIHQAVATSSALAVLISIPGALGYVYAGWPAAARFPDVAALQLPFAIGYVSLIGAVLVMPMTLVTAPLGVKAAHAMSKRALEMAFGSYLLIVGGRFVISLRERAVKRSSTRTKDPSPWFDGHSEQSRALPISYKYPYTSRAKYSSALCPWCCAAVRRRRRPAWAS